MKRVVMLVNNDWKIDSRVTREAGSLAAAGYEVHVISRSDVPAHCKVESQGATFHSVPRAQSGTVFDRFLLLIRLHANVIFCAGAGMTEHRAVVFAAVRAVLKLLVSGLLLVVLAPLLVPPVLVLLLARHWYRNGTIRQFVARLMPGAGMLARRGYRLTLGAIVQVGRKVYAALIGRIYGILNSEYLLYLNEFGINSIALALSLKPDVVHAHDLVTLSSGFAIAKRHGCDLIYDAHELETHTNYWGLKDETRRWIEIYERILTRKTRAVVTVCDSIADWLRDNYSIPRPIVVLNSPDLDIQPEDAVPADNLRDVLKLAPATPLAVYVGSVTIDRGLVQCVQATALVPGLHFAFVGPRYSVTEQEIRDTAEALNITDRVHLVDPVPSRQVAGFVAVADCSVIAIQNVCLSYYFCFPNKLLESSITGVPVAVARLIELERFVEKYGVGVVMDETDPVAIAATIQQILADPGRYKPSAETLREIRTTYGWPTQQRRLLALYRSL